MEFLKELKNIFEIKTKINMNVSSLPVDKLNDVCIREIVAMASVKEIAKR